MFTGFQQLTTAQINVPGGSVYGNNMRLGTLGVDRQSAIYAWTQAGASNLTQGQVTVSPAKVANHTNLALDAASNIAVGSTKITVDLGGTAATADQYAGGNIVINDGAGKGQTLAIQSTSAQTSTTGAVDVYLVDPVGVALSLSDTKVSLVPNKWSASIVHPGSSSAYFCNGVPEVPVTASYFYWSKLRGEASVLSDGVIAKGVGAQLTTNAVAGALLTEGASTVVQRVATAPEATVDTKYYELFMGLI